MVAEARERVLERERGQDAPDTAGHTGRRPGTGCGSAPDPAAPGPPAGDTESQTVTLTGTIGSRAVAVRLIRNGQDVSGRYHVEGDEPSLSAPFVDPELDGHLDAHGQVTLTETTPQPLAPRAAASKRTGSLTGTFIPDGPHSARVAARPGGPTTGAAPSALVLPSRRLPERGVPASAP